MILYGIRNIKLQQVPAKKYDASASGSFVQYCSVFHLFFVPFFPTGKHWAHKTSWEKAEVPPTILEQLDRRESGSIPWYAFGWFFLAPVLIALAFGYSEFDNWNNNRRSRNHIINYVENTKEKVDHATPGDLIRVGKCRRPNCSFADSYTTVMVEANSKDSVLVRYPLESNTRKAGMSTLASYFLEPEVKVGFLWVAKTDFYLALDYKIPENELPGPPKIPGLYPDYFLSIGNYDEPHGFNVEDLRKPLPPLSRFHPPQ